MSIAPLTPANCDLRHFKSMSLEVERLRRSTAWRLSRRRPELAFYMLNLWMASWHEVPCASLEDDDESLCEFAMCDPGVWPTVRNDVLRGWVKCSDGRLYHRFVSDLAMESLGKSKKAKGAAEKRWGKGGKPTPDDADALRPQCDGNANDEKEQKEQKEPPGKTRSEKNIVFFIDEVWSLDAEALAMAAEVGLSEAEAVDAAKTHLEWWRANKPDARKTREGWMLAWSKQLERVAEEPKDRDHGETRAKASKSTPTAPPPLPTDGPQWWIDAAPKLASKQQTRWISYWARCTPREERGIVVAPFAAVVDLMRNNGVVSEASAMLGYALEVVAP